MKVVLLSQWYPPEQAPIGYMIRELAQAMITRGHEVTVITGFPNHPSGKVFGGYRKQWCLRENVDGIDILRMYLYTAPNPGKLSRILTFLTFTLTSAWALFTHSRYDLIFAVFQPLSVGVTLPLVARVKNARLILNVQDLHPDVPIELGLIRNPLLIRVLRWVERFGYSSASGLAVICEQFKKHCIDSGAKDGDVAVIPNWIDLDEIKPGDRNNRFREALGLSPEHVVVLYAGTVGLVSGAEIALHAAQLFEKELPEARLVFVGEGPALADLKQYARENAMSNVLFAPFQPREKLSEVQAIADVSLVSLRRGKGRASVPSKVLGYMAAARPVIASVDSDSETATLVGQSNCGMVVEPESSVALAATIVHLLKDRPQMIRLGSNGRNFLEENYRKEKITGQYVDFFEDILGRG